jgi:uncharacterized membrane protein
MEVYTWDLEYEAELLVNSGLWKSWNSSTLVSGKRMYLYDASQTEGPSVWVGIVICDVTLWDWAAEGTDECVTVLLHYWVQGCLWNWDKVIGSRDGCDNVTELLGAGMAVTMWLCYWEQGWLWHCDCVTGRRDGCGIVTELMGEGMAVTMWLCYWEQGWLWHCDCVNGRRDGCGIVTEY